MKKIMKYFILFLILIAMSFGSYLLIFNQGLLGGLMIAAVFLLICMVLFIMSVYGILTQRLEFMSLRSTGEYTVLMIFAVSLSIVVGLITFANSYVEYTVKDNNLAYEEKARLFASTVFQVPSQKELSKTEKNGVTYFYSQESEQHVEKIDELLQEKEDLFDSYFAIENDEGLTIEFHENYKSLEANSGMEGIAGYYSTYNRTIHLVPEDIMWEVILLHEYTHYQSHLFSEENHLSINRIPVWFEEGLADFLAEDSSYWYELENVKVIDFHNLDSAMEFERAASRNFNPYAQSYLAIQSLVGDHGTEFIPEMLESKTTNEFYENLQELTGMEIEEFQNTFLRGLEKEQQARNAKFERASVAIESKRYAEAEETLNELMESYDIYDADEAHWVRTDLYLEQGFYGKAIVSLEKKIKNDNEEFKIDDLLLAEIQLLVNPQKSLVHAKEAQVLNDSQGDYYDPAELELLIEAYQKVNDSNPVGGYKMLMDQELVWNPLVVEELNNRLKKQYAGEF
ncbi:hypothetical protein QWY16_07185 [Planococcus shenhongbingii]|uniref:tetratricopeptide repeat protein n=1 Tax=Planococcus shenhongbingii TaxID=3058398 RepID=UPI0026268783|nr:hypothetical protein [Planococcus sp. N016]WKA59886.1 hypothetical protein QWY16_07185 [Planococcus sp. N016]